MMTYEGIGTSVYQLMSPYPLDSDGVQRMLTSPVQGDDDIAVGLRRPKVSDTLHQRVKILLTDRGFFGQIGKILQCQLQRSQYVNLPGEEVRSTGLAASSIV